MEKFLITLKRVDDLCTAKGFRYAVIGGIAVTYYFMPRVTQDLDITIQTEIGKFEEIYSAFANNGFLPRKENPLQFFEKNFVSPMIEKETNIKVDIAAGVSIFEENAINRAKRVKFGEIEVQLVSPEDLILYKLFAKRPQDLLDVHHLLTELIKTLDMKYLKSTAKKFQELERGDILENLNRFLGE